MQSEHGKPVVPPKKLGKPTVRKADGAAGNGMERKRMPLCNGTDTGCDITWCESRFSTVLITRWTVEPF